MRGSFISFAAACLIGATGAAAQDQLVCSAEETARLQAMYEDVMAATVRAMDYGNYDEVFAASQRAQAVIASLSPACQGLVLALDAQARGQLGAGRVPQVRSFGGQSVYRSGGGYVVPGLGGCTGTGCFFD